MSCYVVFASDRRERGNLDVKLQIAEPVPNEVRNLAPSSLAMLGTATLLAMTFREFIRILLVHEN